MYKTGQAVKIDTKVLLYKGLDNYNRLELYGMITGQSTKLLQGSHSLATESEILQHIEQNGWKLKSGIYKSPLGYFEFYDLKDGEYNWTWFIKTQPQQNNLKQFCDEAISVNHIIRALNFTK